MYQILLWNNATGDRYGWPVNRMALFDKFEGLKYVMDDEKGE